MPRSQIKKIEKCQALPLEMQNEIKDSFSYYDPEKTGYINRVQLRSILGNFAFANMNVKEIEE